MLEFEIQKQMKRGRFLIQEIEEENTTININVITKPLVERQISHPQNSKRPKHSSIMDSKIIHTTRMDSNSSSVLFTALVFEDNLKDWMDFNQIWKDFSKFHDDLLEDDMEKIFHYIDTKIDESDFFTLNNYNNEDKKLEEKPKSSENCIAEKNKIRKLKLDNKSLILTNFCDGHPIISPAISPINMQSEKRNQNYNKLFTMSEKIFSRSKPFHSIKDKVEIVGKKEIVKIENCLSIQYNAELKTSFYSLQVENSQVQYNGTVDEDKHICSVCKNKI